MKKYIISAVVCIALCPASVVSLIVCSISSDYAADHYSVTRRYTINGTLEGCGEMDCKYCRGRDDGSDAHSFVYYRTINDLFMGSVCIAVATAAGAAGIGIAYLVKKKKKAI